MFIEYREWGREGEREGEKQQCERERDIDRLPFIHAPTRDLTHNLGMCVTGNWTRNTLVCSMTSHELTHASQGHSEFLMWKPVNVIEGEWYRNWEEGLWTRLPGVNPNTTITNYVYLRMFFTLSLPQFPHVVKGFKNCTYAKKFGKIKRKGLEERMHTADTI